MNFCSMSKKNVSCLNDYHVDMMSHHVQQRRIFLMKSQVLPAVDGSEIVVQTVNQVSCCVIVFFSCNNERASDQLFAREII